MATKEEVVNRAALLTGGPVEDQLWDALAENERLRAALLKTQILLADHMPPEASFDNVEDMLRWLDDEQGVGGEKNEKSRF
jgi:hypothetical protein